MSGHKLGGAATASPHLTTLPRHPSAASTYNACHGDRKTWAAMQLDPTDLKPAIARLKRARGQLDAVIRMMEEGEDCQKVVTQLSAASKAIDRVGYLVVAGGMKKCFTQPGAADTLDEEAMVKMFLSLA